MNFGDTWGRDPCSGSLENEAKWTVIVLLYLLEWAIEKIMRNTLDVLTIEGECQHLSSQPHSSICERHRARMGGIQSQDIDIQFGHGAPDYKGRVSCFRYTYSPFQSICDSLTTLLNQDFFSPPINQIASIAQIFIDDTLWAKHWHRVCEEQKRSVWNDSNCICEIIQGPYETGKKWEYAVQNESERKWYQKGDNLLQIILLGLSIGLILFQVLWGT